MNHRFNYRALPLLALLAATALHAETPDATSVPPAADKHVAADKEIVQLAPVEVTSSATPGSDYVATASSVGTKTDTPILETPQSVSVITRDQIDNLAATSLQDTLRYTAGASAINGQSLNFDEVSLRGFGDASIFRDGLVIQYNGYYGTVEPYGLERVEVLKGPASILYGQLSPGGAVNVVTKRPVETAFTEIRTDVGSENRYQAALDTGGPIDSRGHWLYRVTTLVRDSDTFVDYVPDNRLYVAPSLTWRPTDRTSLTFLLSRQFSETAWTWGLPAQGTVLPNINGTIDYRRFTSEPDFDTYQTTNVSLGYILDQKFDDHWSFQQTARYLHSDLLWRSAYGLALQADQRTLTRMAYDRVDEADTYLVDTHVQGKWDGERIAPTVLFGVDYQNRSSERTERRGFGLASIDLFNPVYGVPITLPASPTRHETYGGNQLGAYGQAQLKLDEKWVFLAGGRQDQADTFSKNLIAHTQTDQTDEAFTGRVGLVRLFRSGFAPYASYSESFQPNQGTDFSGHTFDPTTGQQYELGLRYQTPGGRLLATLSAYHLTQQNVQTDDPANPGYSIATGEVRSQGVELEVTGRVTEQLSLIAAYTYTDAEVTKSNNGDIGYRPASVPENSASLWADYRFPAGPLRGFMIGAGVRYVGSTVNLANTVSVPDYTLLDAMIRYEIDRWRFSLNVKNLLDKHYISNATYSYFYGEPLTLLGSASYRW
jgi:iron complex outermembrane receptor protein